MADETRKAGLLTALPSSFCPLFGSGRDSVRRKKIIGVENRVIPIIEVMMLKMELTETDVDFPVEVLCAHLAAEKSDLGHFYGAYQLDDFTLEGHGRFSIIEKGDDPFDFTAQICIEILAVNDFQDLVFDDEQFFV
jgi:hypothetical protein